VTITKSITISCVGATAGVLVSGTNGIVVNVGASDIVYLRGLDLQGLGAGLSGINFLGAGVLHVENCLIRGFSAGAAAGINFQPTGASELYVSDSFIADNGSAAGGAGILIRPTGSAGVNAVLNHVHVENNSRGINVDSTAGTGTINLTVVDSISAGNTSANIAAFTTPGTGKANVMINRVSLSASNLGLRSDGPITTVRIGNSEIFGNVTGVAAVNGGALLSYGNNQFNGNTSDGTMATVALH
jgi:hypothetical protein